MIPSSRFIKKVLISSTSCGGGKGLPSNKGCGKDCPTYNGWGEGCPKRDGCGVGCPPSCWGQPSPQSSIKDYHIIIHEYSASCVGQPSPPHSFVERPFSQPHDMDENEHLFNKSRLKGINMLLQFPSYLTKSLGQYKRSTTLLKKQLLEF
mgnify:FL=1